MKKNWRLFLLVLSGVLLLLLAVGYRYLQYARPVGSGPAGPPVPLEPFQQVWTEQHVLLLGVGDSVTAGFGVPQTHSYFALLANNSADDHADMAGRCLNAVFPNLQVENIAVSGSTSLHHLELLEELGTHPPGVRGLVVMTTGGNDLIHNYGRTPPKEDAMYGASLEQAMPWIENFRGRINRMLDLVNGAFPAGCDVFLADIYDPTDGVGDAANAGLPPWPDGLEILARYNAIIHEVATERENVHLVPMHAAFLGHGIHCTNWWRDTYCEDDPHYWYGANLEDPNQRGYDALRRVFLNSIVAQADRFRDDSDSETGNVNPSHNDVPE